MKAKIFLAGQTAAIVLAGLWVFSPAMHGDWVRDDVWEVAGNPVLRGSIRGLGRIWFAPVTPNYFPLKTTVQWAQWHLWGDNRLGYHLTNVGLHLLCALLFWRLLRRLFELGAGPSASLSPSTSLRASAFGAWFGGLLFAVHPLTVESVAWIAELKNTLSLALLLGSMLAWIACDRRWSALSPTRLSDSADEPAHWGQCAPPFYWLSLLLFLAAMLSKSTVAMFPLVLLLYAWWRRGRIGWADLRASAPFFAVSLGLGLVTVWFEQHRAIGGADLGLGGWGSRIAVAGLGLAFYLYKFLVPVALLPVYPRWAVVPPSWPQFLPWLALAAAAAWLWSRRARWGRHALFALGFFGVNLLPVLGFVPMGYMRTAWVADHFVYLALLGPIGLIAGGSAVLADRAMRMRRSLVVPLAGVAVACCGLLAFKSRGYAGIFRDEETLWTYTLRHYPASWIAHNDLGLALAKTGRSPEAIGHYEEALRLKPDSPEVNYDFGNALAGAGRLPEAIDRYAEALRLNPLYVEARVNFGNALLGVGRTSEAAAQYRQALWLSPDLPEAHYNLANALVQTDRGPEAIGHYEEAIRLRPDYAAAHYRLGNALANAGRLPEAIGHYEAALRLNPGSAEVRANLGLALANVDRAAEAVADLEAALRLKPDYPEAHAYLGFALAKLGRWSEAVDQYERTLALTPNDADVHYNLALALRSLGRPAEADAQFEAAARLQAGR